MLYTILLIICLSCGGGDDRIPIPSEFESIADIATFHGNFDGDIVVVVAQDGPGTALIEGEVVNQFISDTQTESALFVVAHQAQTKNPANFINADITFEEAKQADLESVSNLKEIVEFFKIEQNKTVYIVGFSFGAFVTQELITNNGINTADGYLIMAGRLNIDDETWQALSEGEFVEYQYDGNGSYTINNLGEESDVESRNMSRLAAGLGFNRYITKMSEITDLSKVTYVYGDRDEAVGPLSNAALQFLNDKNCNVILTENGSHDAAIQEGLDILKITFEIQ